MRKIIICNVAMRESVKPLVYQSDDKSLCISEQPVTYPILSCLSGLLSPDDSIKVVLLCKCDPNGNYLRNVERFKKEFTNHCGSIVADPEYRILDTEFDEDKTETERMLSKLVAECEDGAEIISDTTFGSKTMPVVLLAALSFAVKHLACKVQHVFYGQVYFQNDNPTNPRLCDLSYLIYLNSLLYTLQCDSSGSMLMVLLDEMNLAHPEQYFADLLSKFEESRNTDRDPSYEIALGAGERPEMLNIGRNVLWTGTMNEDETTKGLSDKVIDRSMLITFPCPKELYGRNTNKLEKPQLTLSHARWELWKQSALHSEDDRIIDLINDRKKMIEQINIEMSEMGRNLGHRVWQSIQNYILNYPLVIAAGKCQGDMTDAVQQAFCDALAFKMMPKLRGLEVNGYNERHLEKIKQYLNEGASELSTDFDKACSMTSEIFQWNSAEFMEL